MNMHAFPRCGVLLLTAFSAFRAAALIDYTKYALKPEPSSVMVTFSDGIRSRGFAWQTDASVTTGEVRLVEGKAEASAFESTPLVFAASCRRQEIPNAVRYNAEATGLRAGGRYSYRLGGAGRYIYGEFSVRSPEAAFTALNFNDVQIKRPDRLHMWKETLAASRKVVGPGDTVDFILNGGDFIDAWFWKTTNFVHGTVSRPIEWAVAADTANGYYPSVPWVSAGGNHDFWLYDKHTCVRKKKGLPPGCQSFDYARVHIVAVPYIEKTDGKHFERMRSWLAADLKLARDSKATDWSIVCLHWGPYTTGDHGNANATTNIVLKLASLFASNRVDLVLQAHDHTVSKTLPYRWDGPGYALSEDDATAINTKPGQAVIDGEAYDLDPRGTYYVSCGCAGHRVGENKAYARRDGKRSFTRRRYKIATGRISVDSKWGKRGDCASDDINRSMFGVLRVDGRRLMYDFYVVDPGGEPVLYDTLRILKSEEKSRVDM